MCDCSSCDWTFAGSEAAGPKLRVRITPNPETLERLRERDRQIEAMRKQIRELAEARRLAAIKLELELAAAASSTGEDSNTVGQDSATATATEDVSASQIAEASEQPAASTAADAARNATNAAAAGAREATSSESADPNITGNTLPSAISDRVKYDVVLSAERSWLSASLKLFPGDYFVFADVSYSVSYEEAFKMTVPTHLSEAPWLDAKHPANYLNNVKKDSMKSFTRRSSSATMVNVSPAKSKLVIPSGLAVGDNSTSAASSSQALGDQAAPDLSKMPLVWLQVSSLEHFEVKALSRTDLPLGLNASVAEVMVVPEKWPFSSEVQADVSSRGLLNMLTKAKTDAQLVGLQFMNLANQYKEERKKALLAAAEAEAAAIAQR